MQEVLDIAGWTGQSTGCDADGPPAQAARAVGDGQHRRGPQRRISHDTTGAHLVATDFELRLHHGNDIGVDRRTGNQRGQHCA